MLSSFQIVRYADGEIPVSDSLFWPGGGTMLSETHLTPTLSVIYCQNPHNTYPVSEAWQNLSIHIQNSLAMWSCESASIEDDGEINMWNYYHWKPAYQKAVKDLISKIDYLASGLPEIAKQMNAWAEARRELIIDRQSYEDHDDDESEDFLYP